MKETLVDTVGIFQKNTSEKNSQNMRSYFFFTKYQYNMFFFWGDMASLCIHIVTLF